MAARPTAPQSASAGATKKGIDFAMSLLTHLSLTPDQQQAAADPSSAIAVTAGAGSGKTRTLVGRYLNLVDSGLPLRGIVAITFTEKAAREMRTRIRSEIERWLAAPALPAERRPAWEDAFASLEAARIGTIHSLCAEILRAHPAEAALDPGFEVLEEGLSAALQAQALDAALAWAASDAEAATLFSLFKERDLRQIVGRLMNKRLDAPGPPAHTLVTWSQALGGWLAAVLDADAWQHPIEELAQLHAATPDDKLELARRDLLARWDETQQARASQNWDAALTALAALRKQCKANIGAKANWNAADLEATRDALRSLSAHYDETLAPLSKARWALDELAAASLSALCRLFDEALRQYQSLKDERQALDFDDLEGRAAALLAQSPAVSARWQAETHAVLVDEFQDTNARQRQIVYALSGFAILTPPQPSPSENHGWGGSALFPKDTLPLVDGQVWGSPSPIGGFPMGEGRGGGSLFIVGDAKQSIYKFRGADVSIFRQVQADIQAAGGQAHDLNITFRTHASLVGTLNALLEPILGSTAAQPYEAPFAPLSAHRPSPRRANIQPPFFEMHIGIGENAEEGRTAAAAALAERLIALHDSEGFTWGQMALLFRSSTAFGAYEDALEAAGIPFVTVAGRGFYDRPEIRDLLNALAAIADPSDDLALAGLLRSPAIGLTDADLYRLRFVGRTSSSPVPPASLYKTLQSTHPAIATTLAELAALSGRAPAAEVLKRFLDLTSYPALLAALPEGGRMLRNAEKLLADAHRSQIVSLGEFLEYVQTLRDVGLREGEAPVEAGGAVQLMTVHKSKGLEFPLVVLADASYEHRGGSESVLLHEQWGLLPGIRDEDARPVMWQLAALDETAREDAEDRRLLYVAMTRAQEKLLVSGYAKILKSGKISLQGWLKRLGETPGLDETAPPSALLTPCSLELAEPWGGQSISITIYPASLHPISPAPAISRPPAHPLPIASSALFAPIPRPPVEDEKVREREADPPQRVWRVVPTAKRPHGPAWVVGKLVHEALRRWRFPDESFEAFIRPFALENGVVDEAELRAVLSETRHILQRFAVHPLRAEIEAAERYHELAYELPDHRGVMDVLYRMPSGWFVADFKTDEVRSDEEALAAIQQKGYAQQVARYADAVRNLMGVQPQVCLVFLQVEGNVRVYDF
jgi:ATP-dependent helicase/nuclease subunit A